MRKIDRSSVVRDAPSGHAGALLLICLVFVCIHGGLFLFDLAHPDAILHGDRASSRMAMVKALLEATPARLPDLIFNSSMITGDFLQHALLYRIGGPALVIACQIALQFSILMMTYAAAVRLTGRPAVAAAAGLLLTAMPGALMNPHLLTSETWFAVFMTIGVLLVFRSIEPDRQAILARWYFAGAAGLGLACFVRPQGLLAPAAVALCLCAFMKRDYGKIIVGGLLAYFIFPAAWMTVRFLIVGDFGIGGSDASLATNLAIREDRILSLPVETHATMTLAAFLALAAAHPWATLNTFYSDALNLIFNPGATHFFSYYLGVFQNQFHDWEAVRDGAGLLGVVTKLFEQNGPFVALFAIWTVIHFAVLMSAAAVFVGVVRDGRQTPVWIPVALAATAAVIGGAFAAGIVRWDHRAGVEPLLALLAAYGLFGRKARAPSRESSFGKPVAA